MADIVQTRPRAAGFEALWSWAEKVPWGAVSVLGLLSYGVLRFSYVLFYSRFGISPEEVGLGYAEILSQSIVGVTIYAAIQAVLLVIQVWVGRSILRDVRNTGPWLRSVVARIRREFKEAWAFNRLLAFVYLTYGPAFFASLAMLVYYERLPRFLKDNGAWLFVYSFLGWMTITLTVRAEEGAKEKAKWRFPDLSLPGAPTVRWSIALAVLAIVLGVLPYWALRDAGRVKHGLAAPLTWPFSFPAVSWGGQPADVYWLSEPTARPPALSGDHCLMYLGQARGLAVFYDVDAQRTVRLPSTQVAIEIAPGDSTKCPKAGEEQSRR